MTNQALGNQKSHAQIMILKVMAEKRKNYDLKFKVSAIRYFLLRLLFKGGFYFFFSRNFCGFYSKAASIQENTVSISGETVQKVAGVKILLY